MYLPIYGPLEENVFYLCIVSYFQDLHDLNGVHRRVHRGFHVGSIMLSTKASIGTSLLDPLVGAIEIEDEGHARVCRGP